MTAIRSLRIGMSTQLANGAKVFGVLSEDGACTCFDLTAPDGIKTRFALTDEAMEAMVDIGLKLRERTAAPVARNGLAETERSDEKDSAPVVQVVEPLTTAGVSEAFNRAFIGSNASALAFAAFIAGAKFAQRACARKWGLTLKENT